MVLKLERPLGCALQPLAGHTPSSCAGAARRPAVVAAKGHYIRLDDGRELFDACGGAAVACLGHGRTDVIAAMNAQADHVSYVPCAFFDNDSSRKLSKWLVDSTGGNMTKVYITSSGSEAMEGAMKLAREYFVWKGETQRVHFIARQSSYHGTTLGSLSLSGHPVRRAPFEPLLSDNVYRISACNAYRQRLDTQSDVDFIASKVAELQAAFAELGPDTVAAVVAEPIVGAALGCVSSPAGYLAAMKRVCEQHGALLILDEVMCGMGRTGTVHAWQQEGVVPDIQAIGKGLGGGYQPVSAILVGKKIADRMLASGDTFTHGHTYQDHPLASAAALKVQLVIEEGNLLGNVRAQGDYLGKLLRRRLGNHPHVGDIRGRGLFWGIEFVKDRATKQPFDEKLQIARRIHDLGLRPPFNIVVYHGQGSAGGRRGDHIMLSPAYDIRRLEVEVLVDRLTALVGNFFDVATLLGVDWQSAS